MSSPLIVSSSNKTGRKSLLYMQKCMSTPAKKLSMSLQVENCHLDDTEDEKQEEFGRSFNHKKMPISAIDVISLNGSFARDLQVIEGQGENVSLSLMLIR